jgi:peptidase A4-like protein
MARALVAATLLVAVLAGTALGASRDLSSDVSANWSGYVVTGSGTSYTSVTGTWSQPAVACGPSEAGAASAFWVGLGGYYTSSPALEQIGTSADCDSLTGKPSYYAWYELVPSNSVTIPNFQVVPGDVITTSVNIVNGGTSVMLQIKNRSRHKTFTTTLPFANPDLSSAEWVAEAPASCDNYRCRQLSLSNFGSVQFTKVAALGNANGGTLTANPGWTATAISLVPTQRRGFFPGPDRFSAAATSAAGATAATPDPDGRGFTVSWTATAAGS